MVAKRLSFDDVRRITKEQEVLRKQRGADVTQRKKESVALQQKQYELEDAIAAQRRMEEREAHLDKTLTRREILEIFDEAIDSATNFDAPVLRILRKAFE